MAEHQGPAAAVGADLPLCAIHILDVAFFITAAAATVLSWCITGATLPPPHPGRAPGAHFVQVLGQVGNDAEAIATRMAAGTLPRVRTMSRGQYT